MEVNMQQKNLFEQINLAKFKAKQAAQERDLAKNDLERLIQSVKNRTNRFTNHEKPLKDLQNIPTKKLGPERNYGNNSSHSRRNLETYQKLYFNDFKMPSSNQFIHNDNDPFNINIEAPSQPKMYYSGQPPQSYGYGGSLKSTSQAIGLEIQNRNPVITKPKPDPLAYGMKEFDNESSHAMRQIDSMISPADSYPYHHPKFSNHTMEDLQPLQIADDMYNDENNLGDGDIHHRNIQQLDHVLDSIADE